MSAERPRQSGQISPLTPCCLLPQAEQCRKMSSSLQAQNPGHPLPVLIQVAQLCREKQHGRAIELLQVDPCWVSLARCFKVRLTFFSLLLQQFSDKHPESASGIKLTMAQLYLAQGDPSVVFECSSVWLLDRGLMLGCVLLLRPRN